MDNSGYVPIEVAITTDLRGAPYNFALWDIHTGAQLIVFKSEKAPVPSKCLDIIDDTHIITAHDNVLYIWSIANKLRREHKLFLAQRPSVLAVTPCSNYILAGIQEYVNIWQINTGNLLCCLSAHYQPVSVIKITPDNVLIVVGGEDGLVVVWNLNHCLCKMKNNQVLKEKSSPDPIFTWNHHQNQVTDIHLTCEGRRGRCFTTSVDCIVNIYSLSTGHRIASVSLPQPIWSITVDRNESRLFLGSQEGDIFQILLKSFTLGHPEDKDARTKPKFVGHKGKVNNLSVSLDGTRLVSTSLDGNCNVWDSTSGKLISEYKHQGPLSNLKLMTIPKSLALRAMSGQEPPLVVGQLKRSFCVTPKIGQPIDVEEIFEDVHVFKLRNVETISTAAGDKVPSYGKSEVHQKSVYLNAPSLRTIPSQAEKEFEKRSEDIDSIKQTLKDLYRFAADRIFKDAADQSLKKFKKRVGLEQQGNSNEKTTERREKKLKTQMENQGENHVESSEIEISQDVQVN